MGYQQPSHLVQKQVNNGYWNKYEQSYYQQDHYYLSQSYQDQQYYSYDYPKSQCDYNRPQQNQTTQQYQYDYSYDYQYFNDQQSKNGQSLNRAPMSQQSTYSYYQDPSYNYQQLYNGQESQNEQAYYSQYNQTQNNGEVEQLEEAFNCLSFGSNQI